MDQRGSNGDPAAAAGLHERVLLNHVKRRAERERKMQRYLREMTGFGCDLLSYALLIM